VDDVVLAGADTSLDAVAAPAFDPRAQVVLEAPLPAGVALPSATGRPLEAEWRIERYNPLVVRVRTIASKPAVLVLADQHFPGWEGTVDGRRAPVLVANALFRAVTIPAGEHVVEFRYRPGPLRAGVAISVVAWLVVMGLAVRGAVRRTAVE
jgi:hypothetical protein